MHDPVCGHNCVTGARTLLAEFPERFAPIASKRKRTSTPSRDRRRCRVSPLEEDDGDGEYGVEGREYTHRDITPDKPYLFFFQGP